MIKDVLLTLHSYPTPTANQAVEDAVEFSNSIGAKISAIACTLKVYLPGGPHQLAKKLMDVSAIVAAQVRKSEDNAINLMTVFENAAAKVGNIQDEIRESCLLSNEAARICSYARLRDLTIIPIPPDESERVRLAEAIIFDSGRPAMVMPEARVKGGSLEAEFIAVAWDGSKPAARAMADAMPLLQKAKEVRLLVVLNEKDLASDLLGEEAARYLARHGVRVILDEVDAKKRSIAEVFESFISANGIQLLVMGAYGHSKYRELILGGATKSMISNPPIPVLLSH